jgi:hypothetical protein
MHFFQKLSRLFQHLKPLSIFPLTLRHFDFLQTNLVVSHIKISHIVLPEIKEYKLSFKLGRYVCNVHSRTVGSSLILH